MKLWLHLFALLLTAQVGFAADSPTWDELCYLLSVKRESKVFHQFCRQYAVKEDEKSKGWDGYSNQSGILVLCDGDDILMVGVRVPECAMKLPHKLKKNDELPSVCKKLGIDLTEQQKNDANEYLELEVPQKSLVVCFEKRRMSAVFKVYSESDASEGHKNRFHYTARIVDGQVYLSLNSDPKVVFGPFMKTSDVRYEFTDNDRVTHAIRKDEGNLWWYSSSIPIQTAGRQVDCRALQGLNMKALRAATEKASINSEYLAK